MNLQYLGKTFLSKEEIENDMVEVLVPPCLIPGCTHDPQERRRTIPGKKWHLYGVQGKFIQEVFPEMSADEREIFISGTHPECWDRLYAEEE